MTCTECGSTATIHARGRCKVCYNRDLRNGSLPNLPPVRRTFDTPGNFNVVPTAATRKVASYLCMHARHSSGADAALRWLPEVHPEQVGALIGLLAQALANARVTKQKVTVIETRIEARPVHECLDCSHAITDDGLGKRGLCRPCYDRHKDCGELKLYPPFGWMRADEEAS